MINLWVATYPCLQPLRYDGVKVFVFNERSVNVPDHHVPTEDTLRGNQIVQLRLGLLCSAWSGCLAVQTSTRIIF